MNTIATTAVTLSLLVGPSALAAEKTEITVMSFNIWGGGVNAKKPVDETVAVIKAVNPDIVGIQETKPEPDPCTAEDCVATGDSVAKALADKLGYYYYDQVQNNSALWANAILSRYPIGKATPHDLGVAIEIEGRTVHAFNIHLTDYPYQPYQALKISYGSAPFLEKEMDLVAAARAARGPALDLLMDDLKTAGPADATFLFGDFNEPSFRDWTEATVKAGLQPLAIVYPSTERVEKEGKFTDLFRAAWPDPVAKPGLTWTPTSEPSAKDDHHDRIDFTFAKAKDLDVVKAGIVGEKSPEADIVVTPWPSDHRATMAVVRF